MHPTSRLVVANVRAEMARRRLSQRALASRLGCDYSRLSRRLNGKVAFDIDELVAIADVLDLDPASLLVAA